MSTNIKKYLEDGANYQEQAVLAFVKYYLGDGIEQSWNKEYHQYDAKIKVGRWENCREQGYVLSLRVGFTHQLNIAFFEHRNSDNICAIKWHQNTVNTPTIETANFDGECYSDKYDTTFDVGHLECAKMAEWIVEQLTQHYVNHTTKKLDN